MSKYNIYLIEEVPAELRNIQRTILCGAPNEKEVSFTTININDFENEREISNYLQNEIAEKKVNLIIIDYKLNSRTRSFDGSFIFDNLLERTPFFPLIILTNMPDECAKMLMVDPDKIYKKSLFFKIETESSKELVKKLFLNVDVYLRRLNEYEAIEKEIETNCDSESNIEKIIECDEKMSKIIPNSSNTASFRNCFDKCFFEELSKNLQDAKDIISKYNDLNKK